MQFKPLFLPKAKRTFHIQQTGLPAQQVCPKCGFANAIGTWTCSSCGNSLVASGHTLSTYSQPSYAFDFAEHERKEKRIDRTKTGLLLLIIGVFLGPIPFIAYLGGILALIGAILVILGREAFGKPHSTYAMWSIGIYVAGIVIGIVVGLLFVLALIRAAVASLSGLRNEAIISAFNGLLVGVIVATAISGIAYVLLTYALQQQTGRVLLFSAYALNVTITILAFSLISPLVSQAVADAVSGGTFNTAPVQELQNQAQLIGLLQLVPSSMYALAYYLVRSRINRGEIPQPASVPTSSSGPI